MTCPRSPRTGSPGRYKTPAALCVEKKRKEKKRKEKKRKEKKRKEKREEKRKALRKSMQRNVVLERREDRHHLNRGQA